jgi:hypothetical protein
LRVEIEGYNSNKMGEMAQKEGLCLLSVVKIIRRYKREFFTADSADGHG